jgi:hypothetical protein
MWKYEKMTDIPMGELVDAHDIPGSLSWKSGLEYPPDAFHGAPYYVVYVAPSWQREDKQSYLFRLNTEHRKYELIEVSDKFGDLCDKGIELNREIGRQLFPRHKTVTQVFAEWEEERKRREQEAREKEQSEKGHDEQ